VFEKFSTWGERVALVSEQGRKFSYKDLAESSISYLDKIKPHSVCILFCDLSESAVIFYVGLIRKKITTILIDANQDSRIIKKYISTYSPNYIIAPLKFSEILTPFEVIANRGDFYIYQNQSELHDPGLQRTAICLSTSGSTGTVKFVKLSLKNIESNTQAIIRALDINQNQITITTMPMNYSYGLSVINTSLEAGGTLVLNTSQVTSKEFWRKIREQKINTISGVPYIYEQFSRVSPEFLAKTSISKLTQAGGKLTKPVRDHFRMIAREAEIKFYVMYGQTEATARMAVLPPEDFDQFDDAIGFAIPGGELTVRDDSGVRVENPGIIGEIYFEGPNVFQGYATGRVDLIVSQEPNTLLKTGDLGYFDAQGRLYISGRLKRIAKLLGNRINLEEIEHLLREQGFETICIEYQDKLGVISLVGELPNETKNYLFEYLKINPGLVIFKSTRQIPRLLSGKIDYPSLIIDFGEL
jgi:long-subunit acyl-CoA synthetase (AMP-forming)